MQRLPQLRKIREPVCKILHGVNPLIDTPIDVYYVYVQIAVCPAGFVSQQEVQPPNIFLAQHRKQEALTEPQDL